MVGGALRRGKGYRSHTFAMPVPRSTAALSLYAGALACTLLAACGSARPPSAASTAELVFPAPSAGPTSAARVAPLVPLPSFESATRQAVDALAGSWVEGLSAAAGTGKRGLVVVPFIDSTTGWTHTLTERLQSAVLADLRSRGNLGLEPLPFNQASLAKAPLVLAGTLGLQTRAGPQGPSPDAWAFCLVLIDGRAGRVLAQSSARAQPGGAAVAPAIVRDAPLWVRDAAVEAQARACSDARIGDKVDASFIAGLPVTALVNAASEHYGAGRNVPARTALRTALALPAGRRADVLSGLYLTESRMKRAKEAEQAFGDLVALGFKTRRMALLLPFAEGSADLPNGKAATQPLAMWWRQIALHAGQQAGTCLHIAGHVGRGGSEDANQSLAFRRAFVVRTQLVERVGHIAGTTRVSGHGSQQTLLNAGSPDAADTLDRRVELTVGDC